MLVCATVFGADTMSCCVWLFSIVLLVPAVLFGYQCLVTLVLCLLLCLFVTLVSAVVLSGLVSARCFVWSMLVRAVVSGCYGSARCCVWLFCWCSLLSLAISAHSYTFVFVYLFARSAVWLLPCCTLISLIR